MVEFMNTAPNDEILIDQTKAQRNIQVAETILQAITEYLSREGFLGNE